MIPFELYCRRSRQADTGRQAHQHAQSLRFPKKQEDKSHKAVFPPHAKPNPGGAQTHPAHGHPLPQSRSRVCQPRARVLGSPHGSSPRNEQQMKMRHKRRHRFPLGSAAGEEGLAGSWYFQPGFLRRLAQAFSVCVSASPQPSAPPPTCRPPSPTSDRGAKTRTHTKLLTRFTNADREGR